MGLVGVGLAIGMVAAFALSRFTASLLYGVVPTDLVTFLGVPVILVAASLAAVILPARRAARIEPLVALREE
jgi:ABC-type antimicrobial peptide transport system permease subunit